MIVNQEMAERVFAGESPIGKEVQTGGTDGPFFTVVGVVANVKHLSLDGAQDLQIYHPFDQGDFADGALITVARTRGDPAAASQRSSNRDWRWTPSRSLSATAMSEVWPGWHSGGS